MLLVDPATTRLEHPAAIILPHVSLLVGLPYLLNTYNVPTIRETTFILSSATKQDPFVLTSTCHPLHLPGRRRKLIRSEMMLLRPQPFRSKQCAPIAPGLHVTPGIVGLRLSRLWGSGTNYKLLYALGSDTK